MPTTIIPIPGFSEPFSCMSHLFATPLFLVPGYFLIRRGQDLKQKIAIALYLFCLLFVLNMSGVYHLLEPGSTGRAVLRRLDHAAIFSMIAGTFTALHGVLFSGIRRWGVIACVWAVAATAITLKSVFFTSISETLGLTLYLGMGWVGLGSGWMIKRAYGWPPLKFLLWGALAYTIGGVIDHLGHPNPIPGVVHAHELFHIAVLGGMACHMCLIWKATGRFFSPLEGSVSESLKSESLAKHKAHDPEMQ